MSPDARRADPPGPPGPSGPPNILLITSDQHHYSCLGATNPTLRTPALDRLAREGTRFTRAYTPNPVCTPTRASIITGLYPSLHGAWTIGVKLPEDVPTVGQALAAHGYATGLVGKAHFQPTRSEPGLGSESIETPGAMRDLDFWRAFTGPWYGFEHVEITRGHADEASAGAHYALWLEAQGFTSWRDHFRLHPPDPNRREPRRQGAWDLPERFHYTRWTAERSIAFIEQSLVLGGAPPGAEGAAASAPPVSQRPASEQVQSGAGAAGGGGPRSFFLWASFHDPHPPYLVPEPWASMYDPAAMEPGQLTPGEHERNPADFRLTQEPRPDYAAWQETPHGNHGFRSHRHDREELRRDMAVYYGMISFMDQQIGRIMEKLDELGLADNTIVVFSTDHGHFLGQHGLIAKGAFHYEDLIRVPFLVRWPGRVAAGAVSDALQSTVDLAPTFLAAAGLPVPGLMQGYDQTPVWCGGAALAPLAPRAQGAHVGPRDHVIVENRHQPTAVHLRTYVDARYKLTVYRNEAHGELFDLQQDPGETANLWDSPEHAALKAALLLNAVRYEIQREPTRMPRVSGA